jgi:uncharacterized protein YggE
MATISVQGRATVPGTPDEAVVAVELRALRPTSQEAYAEVAERSGRLDALCDSLGIAGTARSTQGVSVQEQREHDGTTWRHRGYLASNTVLVRLADPQLVARLLKEAVEQVQARVAGPWWQVAQTNPARLEACRLAAAEARRKADAYADALGARLGALIRVREPRRRDSEWPVRQQLLSARAPIEEPEIPLHAGELDVSAVVDVTFAIEHP